MQSTINTKADAEFCGRVPLNQTNLIQPHGVLMVVDKENFTILQVSENVPGLLGITARELVNTSLEKLIFSDLEQKIRNQVKNATEGKIPYHFRFTSTPGLTDCIGFLHIKDGYLIIELEKPTPLEKVSFLDQYQEFKYLMSAVESTASSTEACVVAAKELKRVSGFDKVMIYRFDGNWNGEVIAEVMEEGMESYLGLKFPSSDIPKQARELYKRSSYRLIPNINYEPVKLYPVINPQSNAFTDLSDANLRSVATVHLEYLKNMKVVASMSTRIIRDGQLWGLIACHHRVPNYLSYEMCSVFELVSNVISSKISSATSHDHYQFRSGQQQLQVKLMEEIYRAGDLLSGLIKNSEDLLNLLTADGVAVVIDKQVHRFGKVPDSREVEDLVYWLQSGSENRLYHHPSLSVVFEPAEQYSSIASGLLALPVLPDQGNFILAFRPEAVQKISWGGNPDEAIRFEPDGKNYHPRNSFRLWQQTVHKTSIPWKEEEIEVAEQFRNFVADFTLHRISSKN